MTKRRRLLSTWLVLLSSAGSCIASKPYIAEHYFKNHPSMSTLAMAQTNGSAFSGGSSRPLTITNSCQESIWPALYTQAGTGPDTGGFELSSGDTMTLSLNKNWQGRVWARTNCSFNAAGTGPPGAGVGAACFTGDCGGLLDCVLTGQTPVTLAEFTMTGPDGQSYYDISIVDGYNVPISIAVIPPTDGSSVKVLPPNFTNPVCIASSGYFKEGRNFSPYTTSYTNYTGTNSTAPLAFASQVTMKQVSRWCPWDLQLEPPAKPGNGVYPYPDDNIKRPAFDPCYSDCAKYNTPNYCCTGKFDNPNVCKPALYSHNAKAVCPDAYTYAYDDQKSTFIIPAGVGFAVTFCPAGQSTNIIATAKAAGQNVVLSGARRRYHAYGGDESGRWIWIGWAVVMLFMVVKG